jgi:hypothetical protein
VLLTALPAAAQFDRGQVSGTVKDSQGGVVPGVTVTVTNLDTQLTRTTVTDSSDFSRSRIYLAESTTSLPSSRDSRKRFGRASHSTPGQRRRSTSRSRRAQSTEAVTVTAEATPLQTDVAVRKTVEAKDIELLSFQAATHWVCRP